MTYEELLSFYSSDVIVYEQHLEYGLKGAYSNGIILIEKELSTSEKRCVLAEELGHHFTSTGNILDQRNIINIKQENRAHSWAVKKLVPCNKFLRAINKCSYYEMSDELGICDWFLNDVYKVYGNRINTQLVDYEISAELCF